MNDDLPLHLEPQPALTVGAFTLTYPEDLPITAHRDSLVRAINDHQVIIVAGATGSGKSTQLPKLALEARRGTTGMIAHTQPRRIAARSLAQRLADETGTDLGRHVGYAVRFDDRTHADTVVKLMTDGVLLNELGRDKDLRRYDTIIVDEAHERSLNIDFLLGYLAGLVRRRSDLRVIITSATIDTERFARHFADAAGQPAPIFTVEGRTYPVDIRYMAAEDDPAVPRDQAEAIANAVEELLDDTQGDILVFCSGEREIRDAADAVRQRCTDRSTGRIGGARQTMYAAVEVLELFARLSTGEQQRVFASHSNRRVIISTNIAETSLTVSGVRSVVDTGLARISRYSIRTKVQRLPIEEISQASANQRAGRCGREAPGVCIRLYSEESFNARPAYTDPEILRTNLASVLLQMANLNLGPASRFGFIDPPDIRQISNGIALLDELGAIRSDLDGDTHEGTRRWLTPIGRTLSRLPIDPRLGRMIIEARQRGVESQVVPIAARLAISDPRERPRDNPSEANALHKRFDHPGSDFLSILNLWNYLSDERSGSSSSKFRRTCRREFLHYMRVREWQDLVGQLTSALKDLDRDGRGPREKAKRSDSQARAGAGIGGPGVTDEVHRSILSGLLSHIGLRDEDKTNYRGARNSRFRIGRQSGLNRSKSTWVMVGELVETDQLWGHIAAEIQPRWIEDVGEHLIKRSFTDPSWDPTGGSAVVRERSSIFGLPLAADRRRQLAAIDPDLARSYFLDHGLLRSDWGAEFDVLDDNAEVLSHFEARAARARHVIEIDLDELLLAFYDHAIPEHISGLAPFRKWWRQNIAQRRETLRLTEDWLLAELSRSDESFDADETHYPDEWPHDPVPYRLEYRFTPGHPADGVSVEVPIEDVHQLDAEVLRWHVPGYRREMVAAACRSLPKAVRRELAPMSETIALVLEHLDLDTAQPATSVGEAITGAIYDVAGIKVAPHAIDWNAVDPHLRLNIRVVDGEGAIVGEGRDVNALVDGLDALGRAALAAQHDDVSHIGATEWTFGDLPVSIVASAARSGATAFVGLVDRGATVDVVVHPNEAERDAAMWVGTRRFGSQPAVAG